MTLTEFANKYHIYKNNLYYAIKTGALREQKILKEVPAVDEDEAKEYFKNLIDVV